MAEVQKPNFTKVPAKAVTVSLEKYKSDHITPLLNPPMVPIALKRKPNPLHSLAGLLAPHLVPTNFLPF